MLEIYGRGNTDDEFGIPLVYNLHRSTTPHQCNRRHKTGWASTYHEHIDIRGIHGIKFSTAVRGYPVSQGIGHVEVGQKNLEVESNRGEVLVVARAPSL